MRRFGAGRTAAFLGLALLLVASSGLLELANVARLATERAHTECEFTSRGVRRELDLLAREHEGEALRSYAREPRLALVLADAIAQAVTVLHVAVTDPDGVAVAHSLGSEVGKPVQEHPPIPRAGNLAESFATLWALRQPGQLWSYTTALVRDDRPFASIHVVVTRAFLWEAVKESFRRGLLVAVVVFSLAIAAGVVLSRLAVREVRTLEAGLAAIREGRLDAEIPESGAEEFRRLARELNLLREQFRRDRDRAPAGRADPAGPAGDPARVLMRLGEMAAGVAHELRDPLQSLSLELDAARAVSTGGEVDEHLAGARSKVQRLDRVIRGFLTIARLRPPASKPLDVAALARSVCRESEGDADLAGLALEGPDAAGPLWAVGDEEVLRQALRNVVHNAIQATPSRDRRIVLRAERAGDRISVAVADTGPGMSPEQLERAFDLFYTTKKDGTGVGLPLVRQAVEMQGGDVDIRSAPGEGTTVTLRFPARDA